MPNSLSSQAVVPQVFLNGVERQDLRCVGVHQSMGGSRPDYAVCEYFPEPGRRGDQVTSPWTAVNPNYLGKLEVYVPGPPRTRIYWGYACEHRLAIDADGGERFQVIARTDSAVIGGPLTLPGYVDEHRATDNSVIGVDGIGFIYNPVVDGVAFANQAHAGALIHYDSIRRVVTASTRDRSFWSIPDIITSLAIRYKNDDIDGVTSQEVSIVTGSSREIVRNLEVPEGAPFARALDMVLEPYGFTWRLDYSAQPRPKLKIERRGGFQAVDVRLQAPGARLDVTASEVVSANIRADVLDQAANFVRVVGNERIIEATFELIPAWHPDYDATPLSQLGINSEFVKATPALDRVWRDWVLNENGDYHGMRAGRSDVDINQVLGIVPSYPRRRFKLQPCVSRKADGTPFGEAGGVFVEISLDAGQTWQAISEIGADDLAYEVLDEEAGIRFIAYSHPPAIFFKQSPPISYVTVRVTAGIPVVDRVAARKVLNVNDTFAFGPGDDTDVHAEVNAYSDGFSRREVNNISQLFMQANSAVDDTDKALTLADRIADNVRQATVEGSIVLHGCDSLPSRFWGRALASIAGRDVRLHTTPDQTKVPLIVSLDYDFQRQETALTLDTVRDA